MTTLDFAARANRYAEQVVAGEVDASKLTIMACRRQLGDLERAALVVDTFPYYWDDDEANRICRFVERFPHVKGSWAKRRELIKLEDWQCFVLAVSHGWLCDGSGTRRFTVVYIEVPRKNAKTTVSAPVALDKMSADGEQGAEIVAAATKKDQATIVFSIAQSMVRKCEAFRTEFGVTSQAHTITCLETESVFKAIDARGSTQDGANLHFSLNDEVHAWKGRELYDVLETAMGSRDEPMMWNITTAGRDTSGICYELRSYLEKVLKGVIKDEHIFGIIYTIDKGDDIYAESTWRKANPNYGVSVQIRDMKDLAHKARNNPKARAAFRMKRLNIWTNAAEAYYDTEEWAACEDPSLRIENFHGEPCRVGLDLASKRDINAKILLFELDDGRLAMFPKFWLPEHAVINGACASYPGWVEDRWIQVNDGPVVDYDAIEASIIGDRQVDGERGGPCDAVNFDLLELGFDPHQAYHLVQHVQDEHVNCVEVRPTVLNFSEPMKEFDRMIADREIVHDGNPVMAWMMSNVVAVMDRKDNVYPRKQRVENKIDGPVAAIMVLALHLKDAISGPSIYESRELRAV